VKHLGTSRSCHKANHLLVTPDTFVRAPLPGMRKTTAIVHAAPRLGARFTEYTAEFEEEGALGDTSLQRFIYVVEGALRLTCGSLRHDLGPKTFAYVPQGAAHTVTAIDPSRVLVIEKPFQELAGMDKPECFYGDSNLIPSQPLLGDASVQVRPLLPDSLQFDFAVNFMTFDPGASLPMTEIHVMEHGLLMVGGGGIYHLGDCWHPVAEGDFIWMAPYCPQWFCAVGKTPAEYIIYKDWNRHADSD
jgi:(S)-ureidoglycine aminohydrolase